MKIKNRFLGLIILGCCLGVLLSVGVGLQSYKLQEQHIIDMFKEEANQCAAVVEEEFARHLEVVLSLRDYIVSMEIIGEKDFQTFASNALARHPDIQTLAWVPRVFADMRVAMENAARRRGHADFQFTERNSEGGLVRAGEREEYFPVYYMEPLAGNEVALGFDLALNPTQMEALIRSRDSGSAQATAGITLAQEKDGQKGFLFFIPVYDADPETVAERRLVLSGFAVGVFRLSDIVEKAVEKTSPMHRGIAISLLDDSAPEGEKLLYSHESRTGETVLKGLTYRKALKEMGGRRWSIEFTPTPTSLADHRGWQPYALAGALLLLTLILALYLHGLARRGAEFEQDQEEVRQREAQLRLLAENLEEVFWLGEVGEDDVWSLLYVSSAVEKVFGITPKQEYAFNEIWQEALHEDDRERVVEVIESLGRENTKYDIEYRIRLPNGSIRWIWGKGTVVRSEPGNVWQTIEVSQDITQRYEMERRTSLTQKLESIGQLASGIAHEINTPIQYVGDSVRFIREAFKDLADIQKVESELLERNSREGANTDLVRRVSELAEEADLDFLMEEVPRACDRALDGADRVATIVRAMKNFSHPGEVEKKAVDINKAIETTVTVAKNEWKYVADVSMDLGDLPLIYCVQGDINQAFLNILVNAAHAVEDVVGDSGEKGKIDISSRLEDGEVEIRIRDTGKGILPENQNKVFDPFFTTKEVGKGTGQGLAIVHDIVVEKHGGGLDLESEPGKGTTFIIRLPIRKDEVEAEGVK